VRTAPTPGVDYYYIPTQDEWYKAAYHKNDGNTGNYWNYPTMSDTAPSGSGLNTGNNANLPPAIGSPFYMTEVGNYSLSPGPYGTFDQAGNIWEWTELMPASPDGTRQEIGGCWYTASALAGDDAVAWGDSSHPGGGWVVQGFRLTVIPEPATLLLVGLGGAGVILRRRRKR